ALVRTFRFGDYHHTMAFVNALAWIAHSQDHHPGLGVHYDRCVVRFHTHDVGGLSENDFICAAKAAALLEDRRMHRLPHLAAGVATALLLAACGREQTPPAAPVPPPTEVAAIDTPPPQYPVELACAGIGGQ